MAVIQPKILYIINNIEWFWSHRLPLAKGAQESGYRVLVAASGIDEKESARLVAQGFDPVPLPPSDRITSPATVLANVLAIRKAMKAYNPTILHAITIKYAFLSGLAGLGLRVRTVHTIAGLGYLFSGNGWKPRLLRLIAALPLKLALGGAQIIFQNPDDRAILIGGGFVRERDTHLIRGSGVDLEQFAYALPPENQTPLILMATRLLHDKGVSVFIEAAKILHAEGVKARFQIAGGEVTSNPLAITAAQMNAMIAGSPVEWLGKVADMPGLLKACHLFVYPSWYREGIPKVLLEAAATGRAIITTDHPGCREVVEPGANGFLVPIKDAQATAGAIQAILKHPENITLMGKLSRARAESEFGTGRIVSETLAVYNKA